MKNNNIQNTPSPEDILNDIYIVYKKAGFINVRLYGKLGKFTIYRVNKTFTNFNNALKRLNISLQGKSHSATFINKNDLKEDVLRIFNNVDNFSKQIYLEQGNFTEKDINEAYGTYTNMIKELGLLKSQLFDKDEAILKAKEILFSEGDLTENLFFEKTDYPICTFKTVFKSFSNFLKEAELDEQLKEIRKNKLKESTKTRPSSNKYQFKNITKEELTQDILMHQSKCEGKFTSQYYYQNSQFTRGLINKHFGSFSKMLEELNLQVNMNKDFTREDVVQHMLFLYEKHGKLTSSIQRDDGRYSQSTIAKFFGSFENMKKELGIENGYTRNISEEELLEDLLSIAKKYNEINTILLNKEGKYSRPTYLYRLGGSLEEITKRLNMIFINASTSVSNIAKYTLFLISELLNDDCEFEKTFDWLRSDKTNSKLKIDGYFKQYNLAVEYDGIQHFQQLEHFSKKENSLKEQQYRDKLKDQLCKENDVKLIRIRYDEPINTEYLKQKLIKEGIIKEEN